MAQLRPLGHYRQPRGRKWAARSVADLGMLRTRGMQGASTHRLSLFPVNKLPETISLSPTSPLPTLQASTTILHPTRERVVGLCMLVVASSALRLCLSWQLKNRSLAFRGHFDASTYDFHYSRRYVKRLVGFDLLTSFVFLSSLHLVTSIFSSGRYSTWWVFSSSFFPYCRSTWWRSSLSLLIVLPPGASLVSFSSYLGDVICLFLFLSYSTLWRRFLFPFLLLFHLVTSFVSFSSYRHCTWWRRSSVSLIIIPPGDVVRLFLFLSFHLVMPFLSFSSDHHSNWGRRFSVSFPSYHHSSGWMSFVCASFHIHLPCLCASGTSIDSAAARGGFAERIPPVPPGRGGEAKPMLVRLRFTGGQN